MQKVMLGKTGIEVSALCFGAMRCGTLHDWEKSSALLDLFVAAGGNFIDTANIYAHWLPGGKGGESEELVGRWLKDRGLRGKIVVGTKVGFEYQDVPRGLKAATIRKECERSLRRLGLDSIDLYYAHKDDLGTSLEETMEAFDGLIKSGKARFLGASNFAAWRLADAEAACRANGWASYLCVQQRYTYLRPRPGTSFEPQRSANEDLLSFCAARRMPLLPYSPLLNGCYTRAETPVPTQYRGHDSEGRLKVLREICSETGATANQVVLAWMLAHPQPVLPVFSASTQEQMREDLGALDVRLSAEQMDRLNKAGA